MHCRNQPCRPRWQIISCYRRIYQQRVHRFCLRAVHRTASWANTDRACLLRRFTQNSANSHTPTRNSVYCGDYGPTSTLFYENKYTDQRSEHSPSPKSSHTASEWGDDQRERPDRPTRLGAPWLPTPASAARPAHPASLAPGCPSAEAHRRSSPFSAQPSALFVCGWASLLNLTHQINPQ